MRWCASSKPIWAGGQIEFVWEEWKVDLSIVARKIPQRPSRKLLNIFNIWSCQTGNVSLEMTRKGWNGTDPVIELVDGESDEEDEDGDEGDGHPPVPNIDRQVGQLCLQRRFCLTNWDKSLNSVISTCRTDFSSSSPASPPCSLWGGLFPPFVWLDWFAKAWFGWAFPTPSSKSKTWLNQTKFYL